MFRVKICGITNVEDALRAADCGADAIGLNFWPLSRRYVEPTVARDIVRELPAHVVKVGVFVNAPIEEIKSQAAQLQLDLVQLHGDEPPEFIRDLDGIPVMKALRVAADGLGLVEQHLDVCRKLGRMPSMVLFDRAEAGSYGGTGQLADWSVAAAYAALKEVPPLVLAGGLNPGNVAEAIQVVRPAAVDTASGVESAPGRKDAGLMRAFVAAARSKLGVMDGGLS